MAKLIEIKNVYLPQWSLRHNIIAVVVSLVFIGIFVGISLLEPAVTIGIPSWFATAGEKFSTVVIQAPIAEEGLFSFALWFLILTLVGPWYMTHVRPLRWPWLIG